MDQNNSGARLTPNNRLGKPNPFKTCNTCKKEKPLRKFPKRGGIYKKYKASHIKRYDTQCKLCKKPTKPGQDRSSLEDVKERVASTRARANHKKKKDEAKRLKRAKNAQVKYKTRVRIETRIQSMEYLAKKGCQECGIRDPRVLEYDHENPSEKVAAISRLIVDGYSWRSNRMRTEVAKCRIFCVSCHRKHTVTQQGYYKDDDIQRGLGKLAARYKFDL